MLIILNYRTVLKQRYREALAQKNYKERDGGPRLVYQDHLQVQRKESSKDQYEFSL